MHPTSTDILAHLILLISATALIIAIGLSILKHSSLNDKHKITIKIGMLVLTLLVFFFLLAV